MCTSFAPHAEHGIIPDKLLDVFCCERGDTFLVALRLMIRFGSLLLEEGADTTVKCANLIQVLCGAGTIEMVLVNGLLFKIVLQCGILVHRSVLRCFVETFSIMLSAK